MWVGGGDWALARLCSTRPLALLNIYIKKQKNLNLAHHFLLLESSLSPGRRLVYLLFLHLSSSSRVFFFFSISICLLLLHLFSSSSLSVFFFSVFVYLLFRLSSSSSPFVDRRHNVQRVARQWVCYLPVKRVDGVLMEAEVRRTSAGAETTTPQLEVGDG